MNLRELLLQMNGDSAEILKMEDVIIDNISGIEICEENSFSIKMLVENPNKSESLMKKIDTVLKESGYDNYNITVLEEENRSFLLIEK